MKILMIVPGLDHRLGGTTTLSIGFFRELKKHVEVTMVTTYTPNEWEYIDQEFKEDSRVRLFQAVHPKVKYSHDQQNFVKKNIKQFDLVHIHGLWHLMAYPAAKAARKANIPFIFSPHGMLEPDAMNRSSWKKNLMWSLGFGKLFKKALAVHCTAKNEIGNTHKYDPNARIIYVPNGVNLPAAKHKKVQNQLLFIGRLHPKKAVDRLIKAFAILEDTVWRLIIAGTGDKEYEGLLRKLIMEHNLQDRVRMVGFVQGEEKQNWIASSQVVAVPSFSEGMPLVSLETMASGTPLLITKASNVPEVTEFDCGLELEDNEPETIAAGLKKLLSSDLEKKADNAVKLIQKKFLWEKVGKDLYAEYKKLLNE